MNPTLPLHLQVNGQAVACEADASRSLLEMLREDLGLTGTHQGCDTAQCGACTVLVNQRPVKSCNRLALQCAGQAVQTIEGVAPADGPLHPVQEALRAHHGLQCGFCTPGLVMRLIALLDEGVAHDESAVREALSGNLCRCTGYEGIVQAALSLLQPLARDPA